MEPKLFFSDTDPTLTLILDTDSNPDPELITDPDTNLQIILDPDAQHCARGRIIIIFKGGG